MNPIRKYEPLPGDVFVSTSKWDIIKAVQGWWAKDGVARYSHAGIIASHKGMTFEALWTVRRRNLFKDFSGKRVLVGRPKKVDHNVLNGLIKDYEGRLYPVHRLFLFLIPPFARLRISDWTVCSELVAVYLYRMGLVDFWSGMNPDDLEEMICHWKIFENCWEGKL